MERMTLPKMSKVSNNSRLTQKLAETINKKFSKEELADFQRWLSLVDTSMRTNAQNEVLKRRGY